MKKGIPSIILNYAANLLFVLFIAFVASAILFAIVDALAGTKINSFLADGFDIGMRMVSPLILAICVVQWCANLIHLQKSVLDQETKSKWRHFMFLWFILGNAEFFEEVGGGQQNHQLKRLRNFLRPKSVQTFRP